MSGLGVTQIRTYERLGFLPPAERTPTGYRRYNRAHADALSASRILIRGYGWQPALEVMRAIHAHDVATVLALVNARHAALDRQLARINEAREAIDTALREHGGRPIWRGRASLRINAAAATVGVRPSALRFWEQQGLLEPEREASGYRVYDAQQLGRLNVIALLRDVGYRFDVIREVLDELTGGRPEHVRQALEERLDALREKSWHCVQATRTTHDYLDTLAGPDEGR